MEDLVKDKDDLEDLAREIMDVLHLDKNKKNFERSCINKCFTSIAGLGIKVLW